MICSNASFKSSECKMVKDKIVLSGVPFNHTSKKPSVEKKILIFVFIVSPKSKVNNNSSTNFMTGAKN